MNAFQVHLGCERLAVPAARSRSLQALAGTVSPGWLLPVHGTWNRIKPLRALWNLL